MRRTTLTVRTVLVTCVVAVVSVLVTTLVAVPLTIRNANRDATTRLANETNFAAELMRPRIATKRTNDEVALAQRLRDRGIDIYVIRDGVADRTGLPEPVIKAISANRQVGVRRALVNGHWMLLAGRPLANGSGVVLAETPPNVTFGGVLGRLWMALLAGLSAGLLAGPLLARWIGRPIRQAAGAAALMTAGHRGVRLETHGPAEVDDLATALNDLSTALAVSEGREREFLLSVSHELRTPLTTIKGYAEALADGVVGPDGAQRAGETVRDEAERLDRLIADLLVLARLEADDLPIELMSVDLSQLVAATGEAWGSRTAPAGLVLRTEIPPVPVVVRTDPGRIRQVLDGLLENALRVVPAGAPLVLALYPGPVATIEVRDGGPGFTDDDLAVAFQRGALTQRYRGARKVGSGLGLALAARLVRRLGGSIEAGHAPEGGARFRVALPA
jgi:two-component system sensor histidine kinase BaeS